MGAIVQTKYGKIKGATDGKCFAWKGIPYASPPIGEMRFLEALPPEPFEGVYDATFTRPICPQMMQFENEQENENCLYLNVFSKSPSVKKPVMVFIHGGAFIAGSGSQMLYDGSNIADKDVVVVTINYRLAALAMFNFSFIDKRFATNIALKDQVMALKWVYENILAFGGDPEDITVCGQSAGAISVICLLNAPKAKKYIKKAIAISPLPNLVNTEQRSIDIARGFLNYMEIEEGEAAKMLVEMEAAHLNERAREYTKSLERRNGLDLLMPVIDGDFLPERPLRSVRKGNSHKVPLIIGITKNEVDIVFKLKGYKAMATNELEYMMKEEKEIKEELLEAYGEESIEKYYPMIGRDWLVRIPSEWYAINHSKWSKAWLYRFDYENLFLKLTGLHSTHTLDLIFAFQNFSNIYGKLLFSLTPFRKKAYELADRLLDDLTQFIKTGKANWESFDNDSSVKIYDKDGDRVESSLDDPIRNAWEKTNIYKEIFKGEE